LEVRAGPVIAEISRFLAAGRPRRGRLALSYRIRSFLKRGKPRVILAV